MKINTILVPTDFSTDADLALETAIEFAKTFGSRVVLVHAYQIDFPIASAGLAAPVMLPNNFYTDIRDAATAHVEARAKEVSVGGVDVRGVAIERAPWMAILEEAEKLPADLIVMGTRGLTGVKHVALGSTAERVVRKSSCPVLTVKAD